MTAYNVVRFRVKPGKDKEVLDYWRGTKRPAGGRKADVIRTGDRTYCFIGAWDSMEAIVAARPEVVENLDRVRALLEDLGTTSASPTRCRATW